MKKAEKNKQRMSGILLMFMLLMAGIFVQATAQSLRPITFKGVDTTFTFDGASHTLQKWQIASGSLVSGDYVSQVVWDTTYLYPGVHTVSIKKLVINDHSDNDVTPNYDVTKLPGILTIAHRQADERYLIQMAANTATFTFDGQQHEVNGFEQTTFEFYGKEYQMSNMTSHAEATNAGEYLTTITGEPVIKLNGVDVSESFRWTCEPGKLIINKAPLVFGIDTTRAYNGDVFTVGYSNIHIEPGYGLVAGDAFNAGLISTTNADVNVYTDHNLGAYEMEAFQTNLGIENYMVSTSYNMTIEPLRVVDTVRGENYTGEYDGANHSVTGYTLSANNAMYSQSFVETSATAAAERMLAGTSYMGLRPSQFSNTNDNFDVTFYIVDGYVKITPRESITITTEGAERKYNGEYLSNPSYTYTDGILLAGDVLTVEMSDAILNAGYQNNTVSSYKVMRGGLDVTNCYVFNPVEEGVLRVLPRVIKVHTADSLKGYDGTPLTNPKYWIIGGDGFLAGQGFTPDFSQTSQTDPGVSFNVYNPVFQVGTNPDNYILQNQFGTLEVVDHFKMQRSAYPVLCTRGEGGLYVYGAGGEMPYAYKVEGGAFPTDGAFTPVVGRSVSIMNLEDGVTYKVIMKDNRDGYDTMVYTMNSPDPLLSDGFDVIGTSCKGDDGQATINVHGGKKFEYDVYNYKWSNGSTDQRAVSLNHGQKYYVTVTDYFGCTVVDSVTIGVDSMLVFGNYSDGSGCSNEGSFAYNPMSGWDDQALRATVRFRWPVPTVSPASATSQVTGLSGATDATNFHTGHLKNNADVPVTVTYTVTPYNDVCDDNPTFTVTIHLSNTTHAAEHISMHTPKYRMCPDVTDTIINVTLSGLNGLSEYQLRWNFNGTEVRSHALPNGTVSDTLHIRIPETPCRGKYIYGLSITDAAGCGHYMEDTVHVGFKSWAVPTVVDTVVVSCSNDAVAPHLTPALMPEVTDDCGKAIDYTHAVRIDGTDVCDQLITHVYTYKDCLGKEAKWTYTYHVLDTTAPVIASVPTSVRADVNNCKFFVPDFYDVVMDNVTENCAHDYVLTYEQLPYAGQQIESDTKVAVSVTDHCGNTRTIYINVYIDSPVHVLATDYNSFCYDMSDGEIKGVVSGGVAPYSVFWECESRNGAVQLDEAGPFTFTNLPDGNYVINAYSANGCFSVDTAKVALQDYDEPIIVRANSENRQYDGTALVNAGYTVSGTLMDAGDVLTANVTGTITNVGSVVNHISDVKIMRGDTMDVTCLYNLTAEDGLLTINKRNIVLKSASDTKNYDGTPLTNHTVTIQSGSFPTGEGIDSYNVIGTRTYVGSTENDFDYTLTVATNPDNYSITREYGILTVTKKPNVLVITAASDTMVYDGTPLTKSAFTYTDGVLFPGDELQVDIAGTRTDVGMTYNVVTGFRVMRGVEDVTSCYTIGPRQMGTLVVKPRPLTIKAGDLNVEYNGETRTWEEIPEPRYSLVSSSFAPGQDLDVTTLALSGSGTIPGDYPSYVVLSSVKIEDAEHHNVTSNYLISLVNGNIHISDHTPPYQIIVIAPHDTVMYDGAAHVLSGYDTVIVNNDTTLWARSNDLSITLKNENGTLIPYTVQGLNSYISRSNAGTYPLPINGTPRVADANGADVTSSFSVIRKPGWLVIKPLPSLVINIVDTMHYNGTPFTSNYPDSKKHSTEGLGAYDAISAGEVTTISAAMGTYIYGAEQSTITTPFQTTGGIGNYSHVTVIASQTIIRGNAMTVECPSGNTGDRRAEKIYDGTPLSTPALVLNANTHDGTLPTVRYFVDGSATPIMTPPSITNVGSKHVRVEVIHDYYETVTCEYDLKITPRPVTLTSASKTKEYDATDLTAHSVVIGGMGFVPGEDTASTNVTGVIRNVWENTTDAKKNLFTYTLNSSVDPNNYKFDTIYGTLKINPRPVTIRSLDSTKNYDGEALTQWKAKVVSTKGFLNGDTVTYNFTGTQTIPGISSNTFAVNGFNVGTDATSQQTNYKITLQNGTLTVTEPQTVHVKALCETVVYDGLHHTGTQFEVSIGSTPCEEVPGSNGLKFYVFGHENILTITPTADIVTVGHTPNTFTYSVSFGSQVISSCYVEDSDVCDITVTPRPLKIIVNETKEYDGQKLPTEYNDAAHLTTDGLVAGDYLTAGVVTTGSDTVHAYHYYPTIHNDSTSNITTAFNTHNGIENYEVTYVVNQTITPSSHFTLTCPSGTSITKVYNAEALHPTATVTGQYAGDVLKIEYSTDNINWSETEPSVTHVHETPLHVYVRATHHDYVTAYCEYTLTVTPRPITLKSKSAEKVYDSTPLTKHEMETVGGSGWARSEEGATYAYTGTQTVVGQSDNYWSYTLNDATLATDYNITSLNGTLKVTESPNLTVTCPTGSSITKMYDGTSIQPEATFSGAYGGDEGAVVIEYSTDNATWSTTAPAITHVSQSLAHVYVRARHHDYVTPTCLYALTITPRPAVITSYDSTQVYDGTTVQKTKVTTSGFVAGEGVITSNFATITHVGETANTFTAAPLAGTDWNDYDTTMVLGTLKVTPSNLAEINCPGTTGNPLAVEKKYDGAPLNPTAVAAGIPGVDNSIAVEYSLNGTTWSSTAPAITHVGTQHVYVRTVNADYVVKTCEYDLAVTCRNITLTSGDDSKMFDNTPLKKETVAVSGDGFATGESFTYSDFASITYKGVKSNTFNYAAGTGTTLSDYCVNVVPGTLTITPRTGVVVVVKEHSGEYDYDGTEKTVTGYDLISISDPLYHNDSFKYDGPVADSTAKGTEPGTYPMGILPTDYTNLDTNFSNVTFIVQDGDLKIYPELLIWEVSPVDVVCNGESNGEVTVKIQGGKPNYSYDITGPDAYTGTTTGIFSLTNLKVGTYTLKVKDALNYEKNTTFTINEPAQLTATITVPTADLDRCPNQTTYPVSVTAAGGVTAYSYVWSDDAQNVNADNTVVNMLGANDCGHTYQVTVKVADANGCEVVKTASFTVVDEVKPTFTRPADYVAYKDVDCNVDVTPAVAGEPANVLDNCTATPTVTYRDETAIEDCEGAYHFNRVWRVVDNCGNVSISDSVQLITVIDNIKPTFTRPADIMIGKDASCQAVVTPAVTGEPTNVLDNCTATPTVTYRDETAVADCDGSYHFNRVWRVVDNCGNISVSDSVQVITVSDTTRPTFTAPADLTICREADDSFIADPSVTGEPTAQADNCTAYSTLVANTAYHDLDTLPLSNLVLRTIRRAWIVTDDCGNVTELIQKIMINPRPVMDNPGDQVICRKEVFSELNFTSPILDGTMTYEWTNDNTAIGLAASGDTKIPSFTAVNTTTSDLVANITVVPTYHNASLNCIGVPVTFTITVKPSAINMDDKNDYIRCNGDAFSVTPTGQSIPAGTQYVWTVEANANVTGQADQTTPVDAPISQALNNTSSTLQTVIYHVTPMTDGCAGDMFDIVVNVEPTPVLTLNCPEDITRTLAFGDCAMTIYPEELGTPTWSHSLGWTLVSITNNAPADSIYPEGTNIVTWTLTDECGNTTTCDQYVIVVFPVCPDAVDYEGNVYHGIRIDCDCWTQRNLESNKYSDGTDIPGVYNYVSDMYPNETDNVDKFGRLYDWPSAIKDSADNGYGHVQGICPAGWYLPTAEKYTALNAHGADALKSPLYWLDGGGSNTTDFSSLPAGYYDGSINRYMNLMGEAYYWSTTKVEGHWTASASSLNIHCDDIHSTTNRSGLGYSIRCIKEKE